MLDHGIVIIYMLVTLVVGIYVGRNTKTIEDFAVGPRNFSTIALVSSVFASVADAGMTTGLVSSTYSVGAIFLLSFLGIVVSNLSVSFFIAPCMEKFLGLISPGDIFEKLYGKRAKVLMGCSTLVESILTAAIQIFVIAHISEYFFGLRTDLASIAVALVIICYTVRGGIRSVTATDVFQFGTMLVAIFVMCGIGISEIGVDKLLFVLGKYPLYFPENTSINTWNYVAVFVSFCLPSLYPLCIQRMLMAKDTQQISRTFLVTGILSLPFYVAVGLIGIVGYLLMPGIDPNIIFPNLIDVSLPIGAKGLVLAGLFAVLMSTVDSILNIGSLAIIHDVIGSLVKEKPRALTEVWLLRMSSVIICLSAVVVCRFFSSVMDIVFFLITLGNSIFFPGFLWGILGFQASRIGFWFGVIAALITLSIGSLYSVFPMYTMLVAISINSGIILGDWMLSSRRAAATS